eukprot:14187454-Alexandrium_andersonii.AAC.1
MEPRRAASPSLTRAPRATRVEAGPSGRADPQNDKEGEGTHMAGGMPKSLRAFGRRSKSAGAMTFERAVLWDSNLGHEYQRGAREPNPAPQWGQA